jgi:hypothetical protein
MATLKEEVKYFTLEEIHCMIHAIETIERILFLHGCIRDNLYDACHQTHELLEDQLYSRQNMSFQEDNERECGDTESMKESSTREIPAHEDPTMYLCPSCHEFVPLDYMEQQLCLTCYRDMCNLSHFTEIEEEYKLF